jgi:signal transduction histidine kinase
MKRRIIIGLGIYAVVFVLAGVYILRTINHATSRLNNLILLHQVELLREDYLLQIKRVQTDLALKGTRHSRQFNTIVTHVQKMGSDVEGCFDCHHSPSVEAMIADLQDQTEMYSDALSRVLTIRANTTRLAAEEDAAFVVGEKLINQVSEMIAVTSAQLATNTKQALEEIDRTKYILYLLVGFGPLVSIVLGFTLVSGLANPVSTLLGSTKKLQGGDLDHRVVGLKHEFREVGNAFNEMAADLKEHMLKMQRAEQMAVLGELSAALAHEIKNPLAGIKVAMRVLEDEADLSAEDQAVVRKVGDEVTRLETLMKSFLHFARPSKTKPVSVDINAVLDNTLGFYMEKIRRTAQAIDGVQIEKKLGSLPPTMADPAQLQQVFLNLVINAIDAMPEGGTLIVQTGLEDSTGMIKVEVTDTGTGIDEDHVAEIFKPFFTTKHGGTGLGLAVSRQLVEQHGGSIIGANSADGGTVFTVRLPRNPVQQESAA